MHVKTKHAMEGDKIISFPIGLEIRQSSANEAYKYNITLLHTLRVRCNADVFIV